ncbi:MAG: bifunctional folylpolyglutamate synthase/dihydrofolate synthase [Mariprofundaceae bacterium]|nr:bifunctional folylpolyglutamate synthase/dihydrofolate synthase [Mariprofundaceae bacterium]
MKPQSIDVWLEQLGKPSADRDYLPGHERMHGLLEPFQLPSPKLRIRVAGTNGKGSTSFMLASALQACGLSVGLYTSPHILEFNERIRINQIPMASNDLLTLLEQIMPHALAIGASYFEVATALALLYFSQQQVDVEILEAGVGARLDATTAVPADMGLLTPIALDHEAWLGSTLKEIAYEKSYVFHHCAYAISVEQTIDINDFLKTSYPRMCFAKPFEKKLGSQGNHQKTNAGLAYAAIQTLLKNKHIMGDLNTCKQAISQVCMVGRLQRISYQQATIYLDAAHNRHAIEALLTSLDAMQDPLDAILVYTRDDRDLQDCFELLKPFTSQLISDRDSKYLSACMPSVEEALAQVLHHHVKAHILVLGSFLTVAASLRWIKTH